MSWIDEPLTPRSLAWLVGWVLVALMVLSLILVLWNQPTHVEGHETGLPALVGLSLAA